MRTTPWLKKMVNVIRRKAEKHHKPMPEDYLNSLTRRLNKKEKIDLEKVGKLLDNATVFRSAKLMKALGNIRSENKAYKIRNGKVWSEKRDVYPIWEHQRTLDS